MRLTPDCQLPGVEIFPDVFVLRSDLEPRCSMCKLAETNPELLCSLNESLFQGETMRAVVAKAKQAGLTVGIATVSRHSRHLRALLDRLSEAERWEERLNQVVNERDPARSLDNFMSLLAGKSLTQLLRLFSHNYKTLEQVPIEKLIRLALSTSNHYLRLKNHRQTARALAEQLPPPEDPIAEKLPAVLESFSDQKLVLSPYFPDEVARIFRARGGAEFEMPASTETSEDQALTEPAGVNGGTADDDHCSRRIIYH